MANLKEVRIRIQSVNSTQQITKAMKMVSASKLRRATIAIQQIRPYTTKLQDIKNNIQANLDGEIEVKLAKDREIKNVVIILVTSDKGLCGGFNSNLFKTTKRLIAEKYEALNKSGNVTILAIGKKGMEHFTKLGNYKVDDRYWNILTGLTFSQVSAITEELITSFNANTVDKVEIVYAEFKNPAVQFFKAVPVIPMIIDIKPEVVGNKKEKDDKIDFIFEPSSKEIIENLIPTFLKLSVYRSILDNQASEQGARMTAMDQATENAGELLKNLKMDYNRARQAAITTEISEIVGGVAALQG